MSVAKVVVVLLCAAAVPAIQSRIDQGASETRGAKDALYLGSADEIRRFSPGFEDLLADIYWLRLVQYYGHQRLWAEDHRYDLLQPLIEITVGLDPRFEFAYRYGATFLCEPWPIGKGDPKAGIAILEKGVREMPLSWRLRQDLGYFRYVFLNDPQGGANILLDAARLPGAPFWLSNLAVIVLSKGKDRQTERTVWRTIADNAEEEPIRENARFNLLRLEAWDARDLLNDALKKHEEAHGARPRTLAEALAVVKGLRRIDPTGSPFAYHPETGSFSVARESRLARPR